MPDLKRELKELLIAALSLEDVTPETIDDAAPLFGAGLGLDSIDALELAVALERHFGVAIPDENVAKKAFASIDALAAFVAGARAA
jgi:acyl carrier protein